MIPMSGNHRGRNSHAGSDPDCVLPFSSTHPGRMHRRHTDAPDAGGCLTTPPRFPGYQFVPVFLPGENPSGESARMAKYQVRVELYGVKNYDALHKAMEKAGFSRKIKNGTGTWYHLPDAEYTIT